MNTCILHVVYVNMITDALEDEQLAVLEDENASSTVHTDGWRGYPCRVVGGFRIFDE